MTEKRKKKSTFLRMVGAITVAMMLVFGMSSPAMANWVPDSQGGTLKFEETDTPEAAITKILKMPINTTTPDVIFGFEFEPIDVDDEPWDTLISGSNMPTIASSSIEFTSADTGTTTAGIKTVVLESDNFVEGISFPATGVYTYKVTETAGAYVRPTTADYTDVMVYSQAEYIVKFVVFQGENKLYIATIATYYMVDDEGIGVPGTPKVDPTPNGGNSAGDYSQMIFTNTYTKTEDGGNDDPVDPNNPIPDDPDPTELNIFRVEKFTTGNGGDPNRYFVFTVTVSEPEIGQVRGVYKAYVVDSGGVVALGTGGGDNGVVRDGFDTYGDFLVFSSGTARTVNLKSGEFLSFVDLEVGSKVLVSEAGVVGYVANYTLTLGGAEAVVSTNTATNTTTTTLNTGTGAAGQVLPYTGEGANSAVFDNNRTIEPFTGIAVADLPYYVLLALLVLSVAGYVAFKVRRNAKYSAR